MPRKPGLAVKIETDLTPAARAYWGAMAAIVSTDRRRCQQWMTELGVRNERHRWVIETTLRDFDLIGKGTVQKADVERIAAFLGYPTRWQRFSCWFRAFWLERRWGMPDGT